MPESRLTSVTLPNGTVQNLEYDDLGRVKEIKSDKLSRNFNYLSKGDHASNYINSI